MQAVLTEIGAAAIAAFVAGSGSKLRGHDEPGYRWLQWWAPKRHRATVRVVIAAHMLVGAGATIIAVWLGWYPLGPSRWPLNALIYAAVGEAVLRSDWSDFFLDAATPTNSLLHALLRERQATLRDTIVHRHIPIFLSKLTDAQLLHLVTGLVNERFRNADEATLALNGHLLTTLGIAGAALEGKLSDENGEGVVRPIRGGAVARDRKDAVTWLRDTAVHEIQTVEYRMPGFDNVDDVLRSMGEDLVPGPPLLP
jgi:hypothetical protein